MAWPPGRAVLGAGEAEAAAYPARTPRASAKAEIRRLAVQVRGCPLVPGLRPGTRCPPGSAWRPRGAAARQAEPASQRVPGRGPGEIASRPASSPPVDGKAVLQGADRPVAL